MTTLVTADRVLGVMSKLPPNQKNPVIPLRGCVYTDPLNWAHHCIAGEVIVRLGGRLPDPESDRNVSMSARVLCALPEITGLHFTPLAAEVMQTAQDIADRRDDMDRPIHTWERAIANATQRKRTTMLDDTTKMEDYDLEADGDYDL